MPKFGDVGREPSDDDGHFATFMYIGTGDSRYEAIFLDDNDPVDKTLIGYVGMTQRHEKIEWLSDE